jgi:ABC-type dipeptide/oligopeptide/nickel transport system permease component
MPEISSVALVRRGAILARALRILLSLLAAAAAIILIAGLPLIVVREGNGARLAPGNLVTTFLGWLRGLGDGSSLIYEYNRTKWNLLASAPRFLSVSFANLVLPGAVALFAGTFVGSAFRSPRRGILDRIVDFAAATPDFIVALALQLVILVILAPIGLRIRIGPSRWGLSTAGLIVMGVYPFCASFRAAAFASRRAEGEEWIEAARARGIPDRSIRRRHIGAAVIPALHTSLPVILAVMQGTLFIVEYVFGLPGIARFLFEAAFSGRRPGWYQFYQFNLGIFVLVSLVIVFGASQAVFTLALRLAKKALTNE